MSTINPGIHNLSDAELDARFWRAVDENATLINGHARPCDCSDRCRRASALHRVMEESQRERVRRNEARTALVLRGMARGAQFAAAQQRLKQFAAEQEVQP